MSPPSPVSSVLHRIRTVSIRRLTGGSRCYWKQNFFIVFLPFIMLGVPIHGLIFDFKKCKSRHRQSSLPTSRSSTSASTSSSDTTLWLKCLFASPLSTILTVVLLAMCVYANYRVLFVFVNFFDTLVVQGKILAHTFTDLVNVLVLAPLVVLTDFLWLSGHGVKMRIKSFDRAPLVLQEKLKFVINSDNNNNNISMSINNVILNSSNNINNSAAVAKLPEPTCRVKMCVFYLIVFIFHGLRVFILAQAWITEDWGGAEIEQFWITSIASIFFSLMMPLYACFCWAILYQQQTLHGFIENLIKWRVPLQKDHLVIIKSAYKNVADSICYINDICSFFFSYVILVFGLPILYQNRSVALYLVGNIIGSSLLQLGPSDENSSEMVRTFVGQTMVLVLLLVLIVFTVWQAVQVNDAMRYFHVWLNDLAASQVDHHLYPRHGHGQGQGHRHDQIMDNEIYHAFCLLKYYVHSRMEQEQPALLVISFIYFFPGLEGRLERYNILH